MDYNIIPTMTHPYGSVWTQPKAEAILIDDHYAVMSKSDFNKLADYSRSQPSALYNGKMWKVGYYDKESENTEWYLRYCFNENIPANEIDIASREILLID